MANTDKPLQIDIVSDVVCPWCIIGYKHLEQALENLDGQISAKLRWHPFELNPDMPPEGQHLGEHIKEKYGLTPDQSAENRARISTLGATAGFEIGFSSDTRIYNTFDCHRLLSWAGKEGKQTDLKLALFRAYFQDGENPGDPDVLKRACEEVGLSPEDAAAILISDQYADTVRAEEAEFQKAGISSVPTYIVNGKYVITGGQPVEVFEQALSEIARQG
ncbi:MAG: DsbA family oxidoreductase [Pseudomonadota bacterium]